MTILKEDINPVIPNMLDKFDVKIRFTNFSIEDWMEYVHQADIIYKRDNNLPLEKIQSKERLLLKQILLDVLKNTYMKDDHIPSSSMTHILSELRQIVCAAWDLPPHLIETTVTAAVDEDFVQVLHSIRFRSNLPISAIVRIIRLNFTPKK